MALQPKLTLMSAVPTTIHTERCLWQRHRGAACKFCLEACPTGALHYVERSVFLEKDRCIGCGACLTVCPVECFETEAWSERSMINTLQRIGWETVEVACKIHPAPGTGTEAAPVIQVGTCLAAISPGLWFEIGLEHTVSIRLEACSECVLKKSTDYTRRAVRLANSWLEACEQTPSLTLQEDSTDADQALQRKVISAERPILNRRDFLFGFARSSGPADLALHHLPALGEAEEKPEGSAPYQPSWLRRMAAIYPAVLPAADTEPLPAVEAPQENQTLEKAEEKAEGETNVHWPTLSVKVNCVACGACARYCPSGALTTQSKDGKFEHRFTPGYCIACGLCAQVCTTGALTRSYKMNVTPFEEQVMAERSIRPCRKCGSPAMEMLNGLCYWCAIEPPVRSVLDSAWSNLGRK